MLVLGVLLVLAAAGTIAFVTVNSTGMSDVTFSAFGYSVAANHLEMFIAGAVVTAVLLIGISMVSSGGRRATARRREIIRTRREADSKVARLEEEKRALERKLEDEHASQPDVQPIQPARERTAAQERAARHDGAATHDHTAVHARPEPTDRVAPPSDRLVHRD